MKTNQVFIPPSVQTSAERILIGKAYEVFRFPADDSGNINEQISTPPFKPGHKVCLTYNKHPEPYVVLAVAYSPRSPTASSSTHALTSQLSTTAITSSDETRNASSSKNADSTNEQNTSTINDASRDHTASKAKHTYLYLLLPIPALSTAKLKPTADLTQSKVVAQKHLIVPPVYAEGSVRRIPISYAGVVVEVPVEISKIERGLGLAEMRLSGEDVQDRNGSMEAEGEEWKYRFRHGNGWVSEMVLIGLVERKGRFENAAEEED